MKKTLIITDVTRMQEGRVCIAGYDDHGTCVRPVLPPPGIHENSLYSNKYLIVFPFAAVEYDLLYPRSQPPHTEDYQYNPKSVRLVGRLTDRQKQNLLDKTLFNSLSEIFEVPIHSDIGHYVTDGQGPRSLGTIQPRQVNKVFYEEDTEGKWRYRLSFVDGEDSNYRLTITDLAWWYYCDHWRGEGRTPARIASELTASLKNNITYLRIGLARGWEKYPDRCFLQITAVFTFPDYLAGRTFADFAPNNG
jgi:hypothetical protein